MTQIVHYEEGVASIGEAVCAIGVFDGVHSGHRFLIGMMKEDAESKDCSSVIVTFDKDPDELFKDHSQVRKLLSNEDRIKILSDLGADYVLVIPFTHETASLSYDAFLETILSSFMHCQTVHVGCDFRFGAGASGTVDAINEWGKTRGCTCRGYDLWRISGNPVSATRIRELIEAGEPTAAYALLGRDHYIRGVVEHGRETGQSFGISTVNVKRDVPYVPVKEGVYGGFVEVDGVRYAAVINIVPAQTFACTEPTIEPHLLDFEDDLYGKEVTVFFVTYLREIVKFNALGELMATVSASISWVREHLA